MCEALIADDFKVIANDFRKTISAAKRKFLHGKPAITFEKKSQTDSRFSVIKKSFRGEAAEGATVIPKKIWRRQRWQKSLL